MLEKAQTQLTTKATPSSALTGTGVLQRKCDCGQHTIAGGQCSSCQEKDLSLQRTARNSSPETANSNTVPPIVYDVLRSPGQPLDIGTRTFMESRFGQDFSRVRVHTDTKAAESARAVNALAYTVGRKVVFGAQQYSPGSRAGKELLAHELTHTIQQARSSGSTNLQIGAANDIHEQEADQITRAVMQTGDASQLLHSSESPIIRRRIPVNVAGPSSVNNPACPPYGPNEMQVSFSEAGHLASKVSLIGPGQLLIADFGVDWRHVKHSTATNPTLQSWFKTFETNDTYRLKIFGYTDCESADNVGLRQGRAQRVEALLGSRARSRVTFRGMAALNQYVDTNQTVEGRARNRSVVIEFYQEIAIDEPEVITATPKRCGPDSTQWLLRQMNKNRNHPVIKTSREVQWPNYVPFFNLG